MTNNQRKIGKSKQAQKWQRWWNHLTNVNTTLINVLKNLKKNMSIMREIENILKGPNGTSRDENFNI